MKIIVKTFFGYIVRPQLYPELFRKIYKNIVNRKIANKGQRESLKWCEENAITTPEILKKIMGCLVSVYQDFPQEIKKAQEKERTCPVKMGGAGDLDLIYGLCELTQATHVLETGVAYGWSSLAILLSLQKRNGLLYSSDMPYLDRNNDKYVGYVVPDWLKPYWRLFRQADKESIPKILKKQKKFQLIHYDSDKSYMGRMWAYPLLWDKLEKNGFFISDDIEDNIAFKEWVQQMKLEPILVKCENKFIGFIKKI